MNQEIDSAASAMYTNNRENQLFKGRIIGKDLLAKLLEMVSPEFKGLPKEEIYACMDLEDDGTTVAGTSIMSPFPFNGPILFDSAYRIRLPKTGEPGPIVGIVVQGRKTLDPRMKWKVMQYYSRLIVDQRKDYSTDEELFENLRKSILIWIRLSQKPDFRNCMYRSSWYKYDRDHPEKEEYCPDWSESFELNVGTYDEVPETPELGALSILFSSELDNAEKTKELREKYDIVVNGGILKEARAMIAVATEMNKIREERDEELARIYTDEILKKAEESDRSEEDILSELTVLPEHRNLIREHLEKRQNS